MSWSINLSGDKSFVESELRSARHIISHALDVLEDAPGPLVNVSVSGSAYQSPTPGASGAGASFNIGSYSPEPAPPQPSEAPSISATE